eukprot:m.192239 g.192239  ORF g.192239 m.192239 type:complete len:444 (+) comp14851_c2_seq2:68-1399(+)
MRTLVLADFDSTQARTTLNAPYFSSASTPRQQSVKRANMTPRRCPTIKVQTTACSALPAAMTVDGGAVQAQVMMMHSMQHTPLAVSPVSAGATTAAESTATALDAAAVPGRRSRSRSRGSAKRGAAQRDAGEDEATTAPKRSFLNTHTHSHTIAMGAAATQVSDMSLAPDSSDDADESEDSGSEDGEGGVIGESDGNARSEWHTDFHAADSARDRDGVYRTANQNPSTDSPHPSQPAQQNENQSSHQDNHGQVSAVECAARINASIKTGLQQIAAQLATRSVVMLKTEILSAKARQLLAQDAQTALTNVAKVVLHFLACQTSAAVSKLVSDVSCWALSHAPPTSLPLLLQGIAQLRTKQITAVLLPVLRALRTTFGSEDHAVSAAIPLRVRTFVLYRMEALARASSAPAPHHTTASDVGTRHQASIGIGKVAPHDEAMLVPTV